MDSIRKKDRYKTRLVRMEINNKQTKQIGIMKRGV
jgi:hypothetical protein